jgi:hypothetical protein
MSSIVLARSAALVGLLFGLVSIAAGSRVLAGIDRPDYVVLPWLVVYNVAAGVVGVAAGAGLWMRRPWGLAIARALAAAHGAVLVGLLAARGVGSPVAPDSLLAMLLRTVVWTLIALVTGRAVLDRLPDRSRSRH